MAIVGKKRICYKGECKTRTLHKDENTKRKFFMVGKRGGGTRRKYI